MLTFSWGTPELLYDDHINFLCFRHVWESKADGSFVVSEDTYNEPLGRGTEIRLHLREEAGEYLEESKLKVSGSPFYFISIFTYVGSPFSGVLVQTITPFLIMPIT